MIKGVLIGVVSVLALTGCNKEEEKLLADCYAKSEAIVIKSQDVIDQLYEELREPEEKIYEELIAEVEEATQKTEEQSQKREKYGVSEEGYITQAGRDRCKRLIELGEFPNSP